MAVRSCAVRLRGPASRRTEGLEVTHPTTIYAGRTVAITGGAGDIGLATARHLGA